MLRRHGISENVTKDERWQASFWSRLWSLANLVPTFLCLSFTVILFLGLPTECCLFVRGNVLYMKGRLYGCCNEAHIVLHSLYGISQTTHVVIYLLNTKATWLTDVLSGPIDPSISTTDIK